MKILSASQLKTADAYTIANEPVASINLMERAAVACTDYLLNNLLTYGQQIVVVCGKGNNGGDGFAIARMLFHAGFEVHCFLVNHSLNFSHDCAINFERFSNLGGGITTISNANQLDLSIAAVVVDALFGTGLTQPLEGELARIAVKISQANGTVVGIDLPSGLFAANNTPAALYSCVMAALTLSFELPKQAFFLIDSAEKCGEIVVLPIGLSTEFIAVQPTQFTHFEVHAAKAAILPRRKFSHKGHHGHTLLIGGSHGKAGAIILAARACLRAGSGLCTARVPIELVAVMQTALPEAMVATNNEIALNYSALAIGPGLGKGPWALAQVQDVLATATIPVVLDADALNILAETDGWQVPVSSILTPHPKELERLAASTFPSDLARLQFALEMAVNKQVVVVLKHAITAICTPSGHCFFVNSGSAALAKGGSGDVLTGLIASLLSQGYPPVTAACLGVYLHGRSGQLAASFVGERAVLASEVADAIGLAWRELETSKNEQYVFEN